MKTILVENIPRRSPEIKGSDDPASVARLRSESPAFLGKAAHDLAILHGFIIAPIAGIRDSGAPDFGAEPPVL